MRKKPRQPRHYQPQKVVCADEQERIAHLRGVVDFAKKAKGVREIVEAFLDEVETDVLHELASCKTEEELLQTQMYYRAVLDFSQFLQERISKGIAKEKSLEKLIQYEKGE